MSVEPGLQQRPPFERRRLMPSTRRGRILLAVGVAFFLVISGLLARWLQVENTERDADLSLIQAEAAGNVKGMLDQLSGCSSSTSCSAAVRANAVNHRLLRKGPVKILQLESETAYSMFGANGQTRLAWTVIGKLPVVQCVGVHRSGNFLTGIHLTLTSLSRPIPNEDEC